MSLIVGQAVEFQDKETGVRLGIILSTSGKGVRLLLLNRKETTVAERTLRHVTTNSRATTADLDRCLEAALRLEEKRAALAAGIDLDELHQLLAEDIRPYSADELAGFIGDATDEDFQASLLRRLASDSCYFREKKDGWVPVPREEVLETMSREKKRREQELEDQALLAELRQGFDQPEKGMPPRLAVVLEYLVDIVVRGEGNSAPKRLNETLAEGGWLNGRKLSLLLVKLGRFSPDENLLLLKHRVPTVFSPEVEAEVERIRNAVSASSPESGPPREDLRALPTWAIDSEGTHDRDDAFSIRRENDGGITIWIHVADAAAAIPIGSALDLEAQRRATSIYMPDGNIPMLPPALSEDVLSLNEGGDRPALTVRARFSPAGDLVESTPFASLIHITRAIDYTAADLMVDEPDLKLALEFADHLRAKRRQAGALILTRPEIDVKVRDGVIRVTRKASRSRTSEMIAEFMILANHLMGRFCRDRSLPALYRLQDAPDNRPTLPEEFDPLAFFQAIRVLRRSVVSTKPGLHACLGVDPYCQTTSPMRRYGDLLLQRQVRAALADTPAPYSLATLEDAMLKADQGFSVGEEIMSERLRYFLLKYLKNEQAEGRDTFTAVVLDAGGNDVQLFNEDLCEFCRCRKPGFDLAVGGRVNARYKQIDPFEGVLKYEIVSVIV